jgi:antitoxin HicB
MKKKHLGSRFDDFLEEREMLEDCRASAIKFKIAHELEKAMSQKNISKAQMAKWLKTSRTGIDRLLDPENTSITLNTMAKVAHLLGKRIDIAFR